MFVLSLWADFFDQKFIGVMHIFMYSVDSGDDSGKDELKSEISLVHEIALKRNLSVNFEVKEF